MIGKTLTFQLESLLSQELYIIKSNDFRRKPPASPPVLAATPVLSNPVGPSLYSLYSCSKFVFSLANLNLLVRRCRRQFGQGNLQNAFFKGRFNLRGIHIANKEASLHLPRMAFAADVIFFFCFLFLAAASADGQIVLIISEADFIFFDARQIRQQLLLFRFRAM